MTAKELNILKFPIGDFKIPTSISSNDVSNWIASIEQFPTKVKALTTNLTKEQKNYKYRPCGWSIKQVVHHCSDSHINSIIRFKLALTENAPTIRPYYEDRWAELIDSHDDNIEDSLLLLTGLHNKWAKLLKNFSKSDLQKEFIHPEHGKRFKLSEAIAMYAWHCNHHLAHIEQGIASEGKYNN